MQFKFWKKWSFWFQSISFWLWCTLHQTSPLLWWGGRLTIWTLKSMLYFPNICKFVIVCLEPMSQDLSLIFWVKFIFWLLLSPDDGWRVHLKCWAKILILKFKNHINYTFCCVNLHYDVYQLPFIGWPYIGKSHNTFITNIMLFPVLLCLLM